MPLRYHRPDSEPAVLSPHPVVASWMRRDHRDQRRLADFLTAVDEDAEPALAGIAGDVALELAIGFSPSQPLTRHRDLDNYLLPVVSRLGERRIPAVFARKQHADISTLTVASARQRLDDVEPMMRVRALGSHERPDWKEQVRDACAAAVGRRTPHRGAAALDLAFTVSSLRNWTNLWKPTIDAVAGPLLGVPDPENPWSPNDDHITRLGLHRTIDGRVGYDVVVSAWWCLDD